MGLFIPIEALTGLLKQGVVISNQRMPANGLDALKQYIDRSTPFRKRGELRLDWLMKTSLACARIEPNVGIFGLTHWLRPLLGIVPEA